MEALLIHGLTELCEVPSVQSSVVLYAIICGANFSTANVQVIKSSFSRILPEALSVFI